VEGYIDFTLGYYFLTLELGNVGVDLGLIYVTFNNHGCGWLIFKFWDLFGLFCIMEYV